jgi:hypothetical protein
VTSGAWKISRRRVGPVAAASIAACILLAPARADAYRPFDGTDADVAELKVFELELGPVHYFRQGTQNELIAPALVLNYGIFENTELVVDASDYVALGKREPGVPRVSLQDDDVLVKHLFREGILQGKTGVSIAAEGGVLTPEVPESKSVGGSLDVIASYRWAWGTVHWNEWFEYTRDHHPDLFSGVIVEGPHDWAVRPVGEAFYDKDFQAGQTASLLVGAIWSVRESLALDVGLRGARADDSYEAEVRLGLTWSIPVGDRAGEEAPREGSRGFRRSPRL